MIMEKSDLASKIIRVNEEGIMSYTLHCPVRHCDHVEDASIHQDQRDFAKKSILTNMTTHLHATHGVEVEG